MMVTGNQLLSRLRIVSDLLQDFRAASLVSGSGGRRGK